MKIPVVCLTFIASLLLQVQSVTANNTPDKEIRLLVLGDSLSAGYGLKADDAFPAQLQKSLRQAGYAVVVLNSSVSGDTTAGGLSRIDWALSDIPDLVIVELGGNDALRGLSDATTRANLDAILARLGREGISIILAGMQAPRNMGEDYVRRFDRIYPDLAARHGVVLYPFFLDGVALEPDLNQPDGIHPNSAGVRVIVSRILPYVTPELNKLMR